MVNVFRHSPFPIHHSPLFLNYYNYFTEIEETFIRRRGKNLLLSPLDWALIESWQEREVPLSVVLRGIDAALHERLVPGRGAERQRGARRLWRRGVPGLSAGLALLRRRRLREPRVRRGRVCGRDL